MNHREWNMQISSYGAAQALDINRVNQASPTRATSFQQAVSNELGTQDQVSISEAAKAGAAQQAGPSQAGVLSASEKTFFNDSFGTNVFGADASKSKGPVVSNQGASVLDSQEISFFQNAFGMSSQASSYTRGGNYGGSMGSAYGQTASVGSTLNRAV